MIYSNFISSLLIGSSVMMSQPELPKEPVLEKTNWILLEEGDNLTIHERWITLADGTRTRERKGVFYLEENIENIVPLIESPDGIKRWMRGVEDASLLNSIDSGTRLIYLHFNAPWPFKDRDLVSRITTIKNCDSPCIEVLMSAQADYIPEKERVTRLESYEASWKISRVGNGMAEVVFCAYSATPPVAPKWIQDPVTLKLFKDNLNNLRGLLTQK